MARRMLDFACVAMPITRLQAPAQPAVTRREVVRIESAACDHAEPAGFSRRMVGTRLRSDD